MSIHSRIEMQRKPIFTRFMHVLSERKDQSFNGWKLLIVLLIFILIFAEQQAHAQKTEDHPDYKYLFKNNPEAGLRFSTFYGEIAPTTAWANLNKSFGNVFMTEFGLHLNRKFAIGFYLARSPKQNQTPIPEVGSPEYDEWLNAGIRLDKLAPSTEVVYVYFSHSGLNLSYMHNTENVVFWRAGMRFGAGKLQILENQRQLLDFANTSIYQATAYNLNPEIGVAVNLRSWWRLHTDMGYRIVFANSAEPAQASDFYGITFKVGFSFGAFNR